MSRRSDGCWSSTPDEGKSHRGTLGFEGPFCDNVIQTACKSLILNGEMSEWSIEHAWKACRPAPAIIGDMNALTSLKQDTWVSLHAGAPLRTQLDRARNSLRSVNGPCLRVHPERR